MHVPGAIISSSLVINVGRERLTIRSNYWIDLLCYGFIVCRHEFHMHGTYGVHHVFYKLTKAIISMNEDKKKIRYLNVIFMVLLGLSARTPPRTPPHVTDYCLCKY